MLLAGLVRLVLKQELAMLAGRAGWDAVSDQVARSIWEDPVARGRISSIWRVMQGPAT